MSKTTYLSIIALNINGLNPPIKKHMVAKWKKTATTKNIGSYIRDLEETHLRLKDKHRLKVKGWKNYLMQIKRKQMRGYPYLYKTKTL